MTTKHTQVKLYLWVMTCKGIHRKQADCGFLGGHMQGPQTLWALPSSVRIPQVGQWNILGSPPPPLPSSAGPALGLHAAGAACSVPCRPEVAAGENTMKRSFKAGAYAHLGSDAITRGRWRQPPPVQPALSVDDEVLEGSPLTYRCLHAKMPICCKNQ